MCNFPPVIRPLEEGEVRLPHPKLLFTPEHASVLAKRYLPIIIMFGAALRTRDMSRRGLVDFAQLEFSEFRQKLSYWNGRIIPHHEIDVDALLTGNDESCKWYSSFLRWATRPPKYIQVGRQSVRLRLELLTAAMLMYEQRQSKRR